LVPSLRPEVQKVTPYEAGRPIEEVARSMGLDPETIIKLASNESPQPPFPEVIEAIARAASGVNRYPDNDWYKPARALAPVLGVDEDNLMFGGGSSDLLRVISLAVGGPGTSCVYAWPSFVIYRMAPLLAGSELVEVPLTSRHRFDLDATVGAIRADTTLVFVCNPNNPTGTYLTSSEISGLIERVPAQVMVVIDEAYFEYVTASDYATCIPEALQRSNVVVTRTFSKIYGLAALRIGYAVGRAETLRDLRRAQAPFTVGSLAQAAAVEALKYPARVADRRRINTEERNRIEKELEAREVEYVPSQANFVYLRPRVDHGSTFNRFLEAGVIVREMGDAFVRVTVGLPEENDRFLSALDQIRR
jgi:histidinol-phosphate aminotransferase